jgi:hypothetical protein
MRHYGRSVAGEDGTCTLLKYLNLIRYRILVCFRALLFFVTNLHQHTASTSPSHHGSYSQSSSNGSLIAILQVIFRNFCRRTAVAAAYNVTHWQRLQRSVSVSNKNSKRSAMSQQRDDVMEQRDDFAGACKRLQERIVR